MVSTTSILVVEDDLDLRSLYKMAFRHKPYGIHLAASGEEALDILARETDIQLILLDLSLPGMTGEDFLLKVRGQPQYERVKFVVMSGWDELDRRAQVIGADGYVRKPAHLPDLEQRVDSLLSNSGT